MGVVFADVEGREQAVEVLHVRYVAAEAKNAVVVELSQALYVREAREGAV